MSDVDELAWTCGYVLEYPDRIEGRVLHEGSREDCERTADLIPAISVSGEMPQDSRMLVMPSGKWDELWEDEA